MSLPQQLRELADWLNANAWEVPVGSGEQCSKVADEIERLQGVIAELRKAGMGDAYRNACEVRNKSEAFNTWRLRFIAAYHAETERLIAGEKESK